MPRFSTELLEQIQKQPLKAYLGRGLGPGQNPRNGQRVHGRAPYIRTIWPRVVLTSRPPTCQNLTRRKNRATRRQMSAQKKAGTWYKSARIEEWSKCPLLWQDITDNRYGLHETDVVLREPHLFLSQTAQIDLSAPGSGSSGHRDHLIFRGRT